MDQSQGKKLVRLAFQVGTAFALLVAVAFYREAQGMTRSSDFRVGGVKEMGFLAHGDGVELDWTEISNLELRGTSVSIPVRICGAEHVPQQAPWISLSDGGEFHGAFDIPAMTLHNGVTYMGGAKVTKAEITGTPETVAFGWLGPVGMPEAVEDSAGCKTVQLTGPEGPPDELPKDDVRISGSGGDLYMYWVDGIFTLGGAGVAYVGADEYQINTSTAFELADAPWGIDVFVLDGGVEITGRANKTELNGDNVLPKRWPVLSELHELILFPVIVGLMLLAAPVALARWKQFQDR